MSALPFTVPKLAERWQCSEGLIRRMIERGELQSFRLGALIRIAAAEVERVECLSRTPSSASETVGPSSTPTPPLENVGVSGSSRPIASGRKLKRGNDGGLVIVDHGRWG